ncbi:MAG: flippase-like domain-containing protein [Anaerolineales bacterium]|nr:flippase-like domain-containing protein [Anaerolineales bacterium]
MPLAPQLRQRLINFTRLAITIGLLWFLVTSADLQALWRSLRSADLGLYAACSIISTCGMGLRAWRWHTMLKAVGTKVSFRRALYLCYVGTFFNAFLPSGLGGDVVRVLEIVPGATKQQATGTI